LDESDSGKSFDENTNLDEYIDKHTEKNIVKIGAKPAPFKPMINSKNFLESTFFKKKRFINDGMLEHCGQIFGQQGLKKLKLKIKKSKDQSRQISGLIYGRGTKLTNKFNSHVNKVLEGMEDSCAATRCEQMLTHKLVYEMPCHFYIEKKVKPEK
jgi:uncharacterized protein YajQ (UPF0234 family)